MDNNTLDVVMLLDDETQALQYIHNRVTFLQQLLNDMHADQNGNTHSTRKTQLLNQLFDLEQLRHHNTLLLQFYQNVLDNNFMNVRVLHQQLYKMMQTDIAELSDIDKAENALAHPTLALLDNIKMLEDQSELRMQCIDKMDIPPP